ncbi:hypothetical protein ScPMuIL_017782 [Solemya velum]
MTDSSSTETKRRVVLVAMDGSEHSDYALKWYVEQIHKDGDFVLLTHITDFTACLAYGGMAVVPGDPSVLSAMIHDEEKKIGKIVSILKQKLEDFKVDGKVLRLTGEPGSSIVAAAETENADFIVTGCRGLGTIRRTFLGSVSDYILHHSPKPVFVCRR